MYTPIQNEAIKLFGIVKDNYSDEKYLTCSGCGEFFRSKFYCETKTDTPYNYTRCVDCNPEDVTSITSIPHLEDLFRLAYNRIWNIYIYEDSIIIRDKVKGAGGFKLNVCPKEHLRCPYNPTIPLLDQPNLEDIINLFK